MAASITQILEAFGPGRNLATLTFTCTASGSAVFSAATAVETAYMELIKGWELGKIQVVPGATGPTDSTGFTLKDSSLVDILGGAGAGKIMETAMKEFYPEVDGGAATQEINDTLTLIVDAGTNNAVNNAVTTIKLFLKKIN